MDVITFYKAYPLKKDFGQVEKTWSKLEKAKKLPELSVLLEAIEAQKKERVIKQSRGEWVPNWPYPSTWLNGYRWLDEVNTKHTTSATQGQTTTYKKIDQPRPTLDVAKTHINKLRESLAKAQA